MTCGVWQVSGHDAHLQRVRVTFGEVPAGAEAREAELQAKRDALAGKGGKAAGGKKGKCIVS